MVSEKEMRQIKKLVAIILKEGVISKVQLVMRSDISIDYYYTLKPYVEEIYSHKVQYDKNTKLWRAIKQEDVDIEQ